jgi:hypothetical protein
MPKRLRAQITMDFEFDDYGYTEGEREYLEYDLLDEGETLEPRTPEQMQNYACSELLDVLFQSVKYNDLYQMINVVEVDENWNEIK